MLAQLPPFADPGALDLFSVFEQTLYASCRRPGRDENHVLAAT
jgi:hypothetical protein